MAKHLAACLVFAFKMICAIEHLALVRVRARVRVG